MGGGPAVAPGVQGAEAGAGFLIRDVEGGDGHEASRLDVREIGKALEQRRSFRRLRIEAGLGFLWAELDLNEDGQALAEAAGCFVEALGQAQGVDRIDAVEELRGAGGLVGLQVADEVHANAVAQRGERRGFGGEFLDAVFAEEGEAELRGCGDGGGGVSL